MKKFDHPNILHFEQYFVTKSRYFIVTELVKGDELFKVLNSKKKDKSRKNHWK